MELYDLIGTKTFGKWETLCYYFSKRPLKKQNKTRGLGGQELFPPSVAPASLRDLLG